jgi:class 3 adenylate cyclase
VQTAMREGDWPDGHRVRLRIGLHRGRPALTETGYVGISVHATARICYAAHGGQILLSHAVHAAAAPAAADGVGFADAGVWRFQGLPEPVRLYQVTAAGLDSVFPPPRSAVGVPAPSPAGS